MSALTFTLPVVVEAELIRDAIADELCFEDRIRCSVKFVVTPDAETFFSTVEEGLKRRIAKEGWQNVEVIHMTARPTNGSMQEIIDREIEEPFETYEWE